MDDLTFQGVVNIFNGLACWLFSIAMLGVVIFIILAGMRYMWAGGDTERAGNAKKNIRTVLIGALVIMGASVILQTVAYAVGSKISLIPLGCLI